MSTPAFVRLQPDSTGKKIGTFEVVVGPDTVELQAVVLVDSTGAEISAVSSNRGAANLAISNGTASTSAATLVVARPTRRSMLIRNLDPTITVYVGPATVTAANGFPILAGENLPFTWVGLFQIIAASGTPAYSVADEYD